MKIKVFNTYTKEEVITEDFDTLVECENYYEEECEYRSEILAENEVEPDWKTYYETYEKALQVTQEGIKETLLGEYEFTVLS